MTLNEILEVKFDKSAFGYKAEEVDAFIENVSKYVKDLEEDRKLNERKINVLAQKVEEYRKDESNLKEALIGAQRMGQTVINEANEKASVIIAEANIKADALLSDAKRKSEEDIKKLKEQCDKENKTLLKMQKEVSEFKSKLLSSYKAHLELISKLPEIENNQAQSAVSEPVREEKTVQPEVNKPESKPETEPKKQPEAKIDKEKESKSFEEKFSELKFGKNAKKD